MVGVHLGEHKPLAPVGRAGAQRDPAERELQRRGDEPPNRLVGPTLLGRCPHPDAQPRRARGIDDDRPEAVLARARGHTGGELAPLRDRSPRPS